MVLDYIKKLLFEHNCVIIPNFGGIIANYGTASIHPVSNFLKPPVKRLAFNQSLQSNDGLLINTMAIHEGVSQEEATLQLSLFVKKIKNQLEQGEKVKLESIGTFEYNEEQRIQFVFDDSVNYLEDSFGLTELYFKPIDREEEDMKRIRPTQGRPVVRRAPIKNVAQGTASNEENKEKKEGTTEEPLPEAKADDLVLAPDSSIETSTEVVSAEEKPSKKKKKKEVKEEETDDKKKEAKSLLFLIIPLVLVVGAGGIYFFTQNNKTTDEEIQLVDAETVENSENGEASVISTITDNNSSFEETTETETTDVVEESVTDNTSSFEEPVVDNNVIEETTPIVEEVHTPVHNNNDVVVVSEGSHGKVYVIAGAFAQKGKATRFAETFANGQILPDGDKYRVAIAEFSTKEQAIEGLSTLKVEHGENLWVLEY